ncbi:putative F-box domain-containing protein [Helianthus debilis subsp. tardiflorus]
MDGRRRIQMDRISNLPPSIIQKILTLMPMRDAFRTSILSPNWRCHCRNISKLSFHKHLLLHKRFALSKKRTFLHDLVYPVLLLHQGPILEFSLCLDEIDSCWEIDQIILHLSRNYALKEFQLWISSGDKYKLLPAFFNLQHLRALKLQNCAFQPPVTFKGFERLVILHFYYVSITAEVFLRFISNCPLLKEFTLVMHITPSLYLIPSEWVFATEKNRRTYIFKFKFVSEFSSSLNKIKYKFIVYNNH